MISMGLLESGMKYYIETCNKYCLAGTHSCKHVKYHVNHRQGERQDNFLFHVLKLSNWTRCHRF